MPHRKFIVKQLANTVKTDIAGPKSHKPKQWYWHCVSAGRYVAWSGESYARKTHAVRMAMSFAKPDDGVWIDEGNGKLVRIEAHPTSEAIVRTEQP